MRTVRGATRRLPVGRLQRNPTSLFSAWLIAPFSSASARTAVSRTTDGCALWSTATAFIRAWTSWWRPPPATTRDCFISKPKSCRVPASQIERLVHSLSSEGDWVLDPFVGTGTSIIAAVRHKRRGVGAEVVSKYVEIAKSRIHLAAQGELLVRPMDRPVFDPRHAGKNLLSAPWLTEKEIQVCGGAKS